MVALRRFCALISNILTSHQTVAGEWLHCDVLALYSSFQLGRRKMKVGVPVLMLVRFLAFVFVLSRLVRLSWVAVVVGNSTDRL